MVSNSIQFSHYSNTASNSQADWCHTILNIVHLTCILKSLFYMLKSYMFYLFLDWCVVEDSKSNQSFTCSRRFVASMCVRCTEGTGTPSDGCWLIELLTFRSGMDRSCCGQGKLEAGIQHLVIRILQLSAYQSTFIYKNRKINQTKYKTENYWSKCYLGKANKAQQVLLWIPDYWRTAWKLLHNALGYL